MKKLVDVQDGNLTIILETNKMVLKDPDGAIQWENENDGIAKFKNRCQRITIFSQYDGKLESQFYSPNTILKIADSINEINNSTEIITDYYD